MDSDKQKIAAESIDIVTNIPWILVLIVCIVFIIITSDVFINRTLKNYSALGITSTKGTMIQTLILGGTTAIFGYLSCGGYL